MFLSKSLFTSLLILPLTAIFLFLLGCQATADPKLSGDDFRFSYGVALSDDDNGPDGRDCPVGLVSGLTLDDEFGPGTADITRCLHKIPVKVVYQINVSCKDATCAQPYALGNIQNALKDYQITHGLSPGRDFEVIAVVHSGGYRLVLANDSAEPYKEDNPFQAQVMSLLEQGVKIYFCQNTSRNKGIVTANLIPGIKYVTSGVTALADFQLMGYAYLQP